MTADKPFTPSSHDKPDAARLADEIALQDKADFSNAEWELIVSALRALAYPPSAELGRLALEADNILENAAIEAEGTFGRAHTYASENADIYRAQDHAIAQAAKRIRAMKGRYAVSHGGESEGYPGIAHDFETMRTALAQLLTRYTELVNSGDCGNWNPETELEVRDARAALAATDSGSKT
jgi:hypothetical protein